MMLFFWASIGLMLLIGAALFVWQAIWGFVALFALAALAVLGGILWEWIAGPSREEREAAARIEEAIERAQQKTRDQLAAFRANFRPRP